ncbi:MAG: hypothetical protein A2987_04075 [Omnitrophica bacterium RIFCSPLOWO2_01_FULL_45_10]|nr:MAG: hypothetical protein A2987_04075 [Omnitrophica bacterium RIFCSPLOWO2_01_FULL_45_10]
MRQIEYSRFSLGLHNANWRNDRPNVCQFELTFKCPLHCRHCYTDCYNDPEEIRKELTTKQAISILDKIYHSGIPWLTFTGGDPLARNDFFEIYSYARRRGFIIIILTSGALITEEAADYFENLKPFYIELTLNSVTKSTYELISGVKNSFEKIMAAIFRLKDRGIRLKIKTQISKHNIKELEAIENFTKDLGLEFRPSFLLHPRLNGDLTPCSLRIEPEKAVELEKKFSAGMNKGQMKMRIKDSKQEFNDGLFRCGAGKDTIYIDPYGNMVLCTVKRDPSVNLLENEISDGIGLFKRIVTGKFKSDSRCRNCRIWKLCGNCPAKASLEEGEDEAPVDYFCKIAKKIEDECFERR